MIRTTNNMLLQHQNFLISVVILVGVIFVVKCDLRVRRVAPNETLYSRFNMLHDIKPTHYYIDIELDADPNISGYYNGTSVIQFRSNTESMFMAFHLNLSQHVDLHAVHLINLNSSEILENLDVTCFEDGPDALIGLQSRAQPILVPNAYYSLVVRYTVRFVEFERNGLFKYCYHVNGFEVNCFVTSYFETYHIRRAMPSFDNATLKAHFNVNIMHPSSMNAISNMPIKSVHYYGYTTKSTFQETPLMSTYLLAISIGKFESKSIENLSNLSMTVHTPIGVKVTSVIDKYAGPFLHSIETYFNRSYPLPKLDFFVSHASYDKVQGIDNWGLIGLDGTNLPTTKYTEHGINVLGHELVHQFIGNLVSQKEIRSRWLKEGLTTYITSLITANVFQNVEYGDYLILMDLAVAMMLEELGRSIVLNDYSIYTKQFFNQAINSKGSAFTNMVSHLIGAKNFQKFIQNIIKKFEFGSISNVDFINELQLVNNVEWRIPQDVDITDFINSWINQKKFPILTVIRNYESDEVELIQNGNWWIPYNYAIQSVPNFEHTKADGWLKNVRTIHVTVPNLKSGEWIIFNKHATGYYMVNYDVRNWNLIGDFLTSNNFEIIPAIDRAKILLDATLLNNLKLVSDVILYKIIDLLKHDHSYAVWAIVDRYHLSSNSFENYMIDNGHELIAHVYNYYGPEHGINDTALIKLTREIAVQLACQLNFKKCHRDMEKVATKFANQPNSFESPNFDVQQFKMICQFGIKTNDNFEKILSQVYLSQSPPIQEIFYNFLDASTNLTAFYKYFIASVYSLPLINNDGMKFNADLLAIENFNDIEILNGCILSNCYDFNRIFRNRDERFEIIFSTVEVALLHMDRPRFINENAATIHDLLNNIDAIYGGNISERIKAAYDVNSPRFNNGNYIGSNKMRIW